MSQPGLCCSFCRESQYQVRKLIAGPGAYICDACVELAGGVVSSGQATATRLGQVRAVPAQDAQATCTFCGKPPGRVTTLAALTAGPSEEPSGPPVICVECLELCEEIVAEELGPTP